MYIETSGHSQITTLMVTNLVLWFPYIGLCVLIAAAVCQPQKPRSHADLVILVY